MNKVEPIVLRDRLLVDFSKITAIVLWSPQPTRLSTLLIGKETLVASRAALRGAGTSRPGQTEV